MQECLGAKSHEKAWSVRGERMTQSPELLPSLTPKSLWAHWSGLFLRVSKKQPHYLGGSAPHICAHMALLQMQPIQSRHPVQYTAWHMSIPSHPSPWRRSESGWWSCIDQILRHYLACVWFPLRCRRTQFTNSQLTLVVNLLSCEFLHHQRKKLV